MDLITAKDYIEKKSNDRVIMRKSFLMVFLNQISNRCKDMRKEIQIYNEDKVIGQMIYRLENDVREFKADILNVMEAK